MKPEDEFHGKDRRRSVRWKQFIPARISLINGDKEIILKGIQSASIHNISSIGACLEVTQLDEGLKDGLTSGSIKVFLEIDLPGAKEPILALAKVIWLSKLWKEKWEPEGGYLMGVKFVDITASSRDIIREYILRLYADSSRKETG